MPLRRRFASSPQQQQHLQQSFLKPVLAAAAVAGGFYLYQEVVANRESEAKTSSPKTSSPKASTSDKVADKATEKATTPVAPVGQEGKKAAEAAEVKPSPPVALNKDEFREFELVEVEDLTPNTRRLRFALPSRDHVLGLPVASCVVTKADIGNDTSPLHSSLYSLLESLFAPSLATRSDLEKSARKRSDDLARVEPERKTHLTLALCVVCAVCVGENGKPVIRPYTPVTNDKADKGYFDFVVKVQRVCDTRWGDVGWV
jgi:hypothetical protein